jgi:hypothetical protein
MAEDFGVFYTAFGLPSDSLDRLQTSGARRGGQRESRDDEGCIGVQRLGSGRDIVLPVLLIGRRVR